MPIPRYFWNRQWLSLNLPMLTKYVPNPITNTFFYFSVKSLRKYRLPPSLKWLPIKVQHWKMMLFSVFFGLLSWFACLSKLQTKKKLTTVQTSWTQRLNPSKKSSNFEPVFGQTLVKIFEPFRTHVWLHKWNYTYNP